MKLKIFYSVSNGGDGSAYPHFTTNEKYADIHQELVNMNEGWGEDCVGSLEVESDSPITLTGNYNITKESLLEDIGYNLDTKDKDTLKRLQELKLELENE